MKILKLLVSLNYIYSFWKNTNPTQESSKQEDGLHVCFMTKPGPTHIHIML